MGNRSLPHYSRRKAVKTFAGASVLGICGAKPVTAEEASEENPWYMSFAEDYSSEYHGDTYDGCVEITTRYAGSYKAGGEYVHKFYNCGTSGIRKNGSKHDGILEDYAIVENKNPETDDIVSHVGDGESKWLNAASPEESSSSDPITDAAETTIKEAIGTVEDYMGWAIAAGEIVDALAYHGNDEPDSGTWTNKWEYDGGPGAPVSECSNSARFWIVVPESRRGEQIEVKTKQKTDIPPINDEADEPMPIVSQTWSPRTDDDGSSDSQSSSSLSSGETTDIPGSVEKYSDIFMHNGEFNDNISRTISVENLPKDIQKRTNSDTVEKFYMPWEVTVLSNNT